MTNEKFHEDLQQARQELSDAMAVVMELAKNRQGVRGRMGQGA
jgi:hypothetical protein